jgi:hypothetical protein
VTRTVPNSPKLGTAIPRTLYPPPLPAGGVEAAETVNVDDEALEPGAIVEGLNEQVKPAGAAQVREI